MAAKIPLLVGAIVAAGSLSAASLATLGNFTSSTQSNLQDNSKISEQEKLRKEFYEKELYDQVQMCPFSNLDECFKKENELKSYFPSPKEDELWKKLYKELSENTKDAPGLSHIGYPESLKDYCYEEIEKSINLFKRNDPKSKEYFNVGGNSLNGREHERCVLTIDSLKQQ